MPGARGRLWVRQSSWRVLLLSKGRIFQRLVSDLPRGIIFFGYQKVESKSSRVISTELLLKRGLICNLNAVVKIVKIFAN